MIVFFYSLENKNRPYQCLKPVLTDKETLDLLDNNNLESQGNNILDSLQYEIPIKLPSIKPEYELNEEINDEQESFDRLKVKSRPMFTLGSFESIDYSVTSKISNICSKSNSIKKKGNRNYHSTDRHIISLLDLDPLFPVSKASTFTLAGLDVLDLQMSLNKIKIFENCSQTLWDLMKMLERNDKVNSIKRRNNSIKSNEFITDNKPINDLQITAIINRSYNIYSHLLIIEIGLSILNASGTLNQYHSSIKDFHLS